MVEGIAPIPGARCLKVTCKMCSLDGENFSTHIAATSQEVRYLTAPTCDTTYIEKAAQNGYLFA